MTETSIEIQAKEKTRRYLNEALGKVTPPRITLNPDVWLQETVAILSETSIEMIRIMAEKPEQAEQFIRVFVLVTNLAADSQTMLRKGANGPPKPPVAPVAALDNNDDMEKRLDTLEVDMKDVRERLVRVETKLDTKAEKSDLLTTELRLGGLGVLGFAAMLGVLAKGFGWL